jgi:glycosyltransferase involved in cell wall biosynthesis
VECFVVDASDGRLRDISPIYTNVSWLGFHSKNQKKRITIAEQRNVGVLASSGEVVIFCDAGGSPDNGWFSSITAPLLSGQQQLVGGPIYATNESSMNTWTNLQNDGEEIQYPTTANLGLTRRAFNLVSGFNEDLDYGSDADLVWRLNEQGIKQICVAKAIMGLDGGTKSRESKRAWRYGQALANLLLLHPKRSSSKAKSNPEIWVYPVLTLIFVFALLPFGTRRIVATIFLLSNLFLLLKNIKSRHPIQLLINHYIYGLGFCHQFLRRFLPTFKLAKVLIFPSDDIRYLEELYKGMRLIGQKEITVSPFPKLTPSNTLNIFLLPFISLILRARGTKIIHIHWLYRFNLVWSKGNLSGILIEKWFKLWIQSLHWAGIKIIWTAHNLLPHDPIFRDDLAIRNYLVQRCASVIALSSQAEEEVKMNFGATQICVIPEGPLIHPTTFSKAEFRAKLQVPEGNLLLVSLGNLAPYKGISDLLVASCKLDQKISIRIAGWCDAAEQNELEKLCREANANGSDIAIAFGKLNKNEFGGYLQAADFYVAPFRKITNSGSVNAALTAGLPVVIPDLPNLNWIPRYASVVYHPNGDGCALAVVMDLLTTITQEEMVSMQTFATEFISQNSWASVAEKHISLYKKVLN